MLELYYSQPAMTPGFQAMRNEYRTEDENYLRYALRNGFNSDVELDTSSVNTEASTEYTDERAAANVA